VLHSATFVEVKTISQRELRNDNAEVMRGVEQGESYTVTRRGVPVARVTPIPADTDLRCIRPATRRTRFSELERVALPTPTEALLDELRGDR
jgi:prevent-host-death family protein